jgi:hypothetical protein
MKILIITTSGGSGHLQTAKAMQEKLKEEDPDIEIIQKELFLDLGIKNICKIGINSYNRIQKRGSVHSKEIMVNLLTLADRIFWPIFFIHLVIYLLKNDFDRIIDTQPVGTASVIKAIRVYNKIKKKNLILEKIVVDLPTKRTTNFFKNIKKLSNKDRKFLRLISVRPLLEDEKTDEEFWLKHTNMPLDKIVYEEYIVRKAFKNLQNKTLYEPTTEIKVKIMHAKQKKIVLKILKKTKTNFILKNDIFTFFIAKEDKLVTLLLGSQPAIVSTINYVKSFVNMMKTSFVKNKCYFFVFCANEIKIFKKICSLIEKDDFYPKNLKLILMPFQDENTIAKLFFRSDITITRSGGSTILELLTVGQGKLLIHTESIKEPLKGIPYWEAGNALYLQSKKKSDFVNPKRLSKVVLSNLAD